MCREPLSVRHEELVGFWEPNESSAVAGGQARGYAPYPEPSGPAWPAAGTGGPTSAGPVARRPPAPQRPLSVREGGGREQGDGTAGLVFYFGPFY